MSIPLSALRGVSSVPPICRPVTARRLRTKVFPGGGSGGRRRFRPNGATRRITVSRWPIRSRCRRIFGILVTSLKPVWQRPIRGDRLPFKRSRARWARFRLSRRSLFPTYCHVSTIIVTVIGRRTRRSSVPLFLVIVVISKSLFDQIVGLMTRLRLDEFTCLATV